MAKLVFFAVVTLALVVLSTAEEDNTLQQQCQRKLQQSSLDACQQVVDHQLAIQLPFFQPRLSLLRSSEWRTWVQVQCCQQLRGVSRECRATTIRQIVKQYEQQAVAPLREGSYYPREHEEQQGGSYYPSDLIHNKSKGGSSKSKGGTAPAKSKGCTVLAKLTVNNNKRKGFTTPAKLFCSSNNRKKGSKASPRPSTSNSTEDMSPLAPPTRESSSTMASSLQPNLSSVKPCSSRRDKVSTLASTASRRSSSPHGFRTEQ